MSNHSCVHCGLPSGKHISHNELSDCLKLAKDAICKLSKYRLLEGENDKISDELRRETLELAYSFHRKEMHDAVKTEVEQHPEPDEDDSEKFIPIQE